MIDKDTIIKLAREAGWSDWQLDGINPSELERLANFYAAAYKLGLDDAAKVCDGLKEKTLAAQRPGQLDDLTNTQIRMVAHLGCENCATAIRALGDNSDAAIDAARKVER